MKNIVSYLVIGMILFTSGAYATSTSKTLSGGNSTFGYSATAGFFDSYTPSGTVAYKITPSSTVTAKILNNNFNLFSGSESLEFRRDSKIRKVCSLSVANINVYYTDQVVISGNNNLAVALIKDGPGYQTPPGFMVGPIPVVITAKPSLSLGVKGTANATTTGCALSAGVPYVDAAVKASGGVGCSLASAGVEGALSLLYSELKPGVSMNYGTRAIVYGVNWDTRTLNGNLSAYAKASLPNPWGAQIGIKYTKQICSWPGVPISTIPVYNAAIRF